MSCQELNSFRSCDTDSLYKVFGFLVVADVLRLASTSSETALACIDCIIYVYQAHRVSIPWRLSFSLYLRAERSACAHTLQTVRRLPFVAFLSRACRACGKRTQRAVHGVLLCAECTRNSKLKYTWMVPRQVSTMMGAHGIRIHKGPRCELVFAHDITTLTGKSRTRIKQVAKSLLR